MAKRPGVRRSTKHVDPPTNREQDAADRKRAIDAGNRHASYMRGWKNGSCMNAMDPAFSSDLVSDNTLKIAYELGYKNGRDARQRASEVATGLYGHAPGILRVGNDFPITPVERFIHPNFERHVFVCSTRITPTGETCMLCSELYSHWLHEVGP